MAANTIALIAAMPEEFKPLLRRVGTCRREHVSGFNLYRFTAGGRDLSLIESGIGAKRAAQATGIIIAESAPDIILNFGFAGAVLAGPVVGDIVVAERLLFLREMLLIDQAGLPAGLSETVLPLLEKGCIGKGFDIYRGSFVTAVKILDKRRVAGLLPSGTMNPVLEMESTAIARVAAGAGIPLVAVRAISDGAGEELGFDIEDFIDEEMQIRVWKVLITLARRPGLIPQLFRLARNSRIAGENLAVAVLALLKNLHGL